MTDTIADSRHALEILRVVNDYRVAKLLLVSTRLRVFDLLSGLPKTPSSLATEFSRGASLRRGVGEMWVSSAWAGGCRVTGIR